MYQIMRHRPGYSTPHTVVETASNERRAQAAADDLNNDAHWEQSPYRYYYQLARPEAR